MNLWHGDTSAEHVNYQTVCRLETLALCEAKRGREGGGESEGEQERAKGGIQTETDRQPETEAYTWPNVSEMQKGHQVVSNLRKEADLAKGLFAGTWHRGALTWHVFGLMGLILGSTNSPSPPTMPIHGRLQN